MRLRPSLGLRASRAFGVALLLGCIVVASAVPAAAAPSEASVSGEWSTAPMPDGQVAPIAARNRAEPRLESALEDVAQAAGRGSVHALDAARRVGIRTAGELVQVMLSVRPDVPGAAQAAVERAGGEVTNVARDGRYVQAFIPPAGLRGLARARGVLAVRRPPLVTPVAGVQMTQGDAALGGQPWRSSGNVGAGVKVGILDVGFSGYRQLLGSELPSSVTVKSFVAGETDADVDGTTRHGTACAEIVHDVAPGAQLYFAKVATVLEIEAAADWLQAQGVRVISSSIGTYNVTPGDGTGYFEDIVAEKRAAGITWFTAASNDREAHWGGASNIDVNGIHVFDAVEGQNVNVFGPGNDTAYELGPGVPLEVHVRWNDWTAPVDQDFDLYIVRWNGAAWVDIAASEELQTGAAGQTPTESAFAFTTGAATVYGWVVSEWNATQTVNFEMFTGGIPIDERVQQRSLSNLADANSAVTVAALNVTNFAQEPYSSEGPTNGPGGSAAGGNVKPDISGFANVNTVSYGTGAGKFNGTSAATPHVAGAAALALQANPGFTPSDLEAFLVGRAVDLGAAGLDTDFGHGRVHLGAAPAGLDTTPPTVGVPNANFRTGVAVGTNSTPIKLNVAFTATDPSHIARTQLQQKVNSGAFADIALPTYTATGAIVSVATSNTTLRTFRAQASDFAQNTSGYATGGALRVRVRQNGSTAIVQTGSWTTQTNTKFYGGSLRYASVAGRRQTLSGTMQDIAIVASTGPNRGIAKVFVDGVDVATVDLYSSSALHRQVVWSMDFGSSGTHTVEWRVTGTKRPASTGTRVDFDAFLLMQP